MKATTPQPNRSETGSILVYFVFVLVIVSAIASVSAFTLNAVSLAHRRADMISATQLAEGGTALACAELEKAYYTNSGALGTTLKNTYGYSGPTNLPGNVVGYSRTVTAPFTVGTVTVRISFTNSSSPSFATVLGTATVGKVQQSATVQIEMAYAYGAAILSVNPGSASKTIAKDRAAGNVTIWGEKVGTTIIDGGQGLAILANGRANIDAYSIVPPKSVSMTNYNTANQIPDYTLAGATNQLFDFNRFIMAADYTSNGPSKLKNNHFTTLSNFMNVVAYSNASGTYLEGVIVVDVKQADFTKYSSGITPALLNNKPINVHGTLLFNFASDVAATDYFMNSAVVNINPANLTGLNATNPATFTTGYPPVYVNPAQNPTNSFVTKGLTDHGFQPFVGSDDLPALMYNTGIFDIHGAANVCGAIYTPSYIEIENLNLNIQYFKGTLIAGGGVLIDNHWTSKATTIVSYDPAAVDMLATSGSKGKTVKPIFWQ